jgi:1-hydroxycarotenoid 3,4-desaturase
MRTHRVAVIGAGIGGLVAALGLAARGVDGTVLERAAAPGGKMREVEVGGARIDGGPTVFTMRWVLEEIFAEAGRSLDQHLTMKPATVLARHAWDGAGQLDLFADIDRSADAIAAFAGRRRRGAIAASATARGASTPRSRAPLSARRSLPSSRC